MLIPFLALQQHILSTLTDVQTCRIWNDNVVNLIDGNDSIYALDAIFIEFPDEIKWDQIGNGVQIVDPLMIKFHYISAFYDAQDGTQDQNLEIFAKTTLLFNTIQDWMPTTVTIPAGGMYDKYAGTYTVPFGVFQRIGELQDKSHGAIYHFVQTYNTTWLDGTRERPVGGFLAGNLNYELDMVVIWDNSSFYIAASPVSYVLYNGGIYKCIQNTTAAHELPTNALYFKYVRKQ